MLLLAPFQAVPSTTLYVSDNRSVSREGISATRLEFVMLLLLLWF